MKRVCGKDKPFFVFETDGLTVVGDWRDRYSRGILRMPGYEVASAKWILSSLNSHPGAMIDAGANMGVLAGLVAKGTPNTVLAIEPDLETAMRCASMVALNGYRHGAVLHAAVGDQDGKVTFFTAPGRSDAASLSAGTVGAGAVPVEVDLFTLDTIAEQLHEPIGFLKVDVEGYEPQAFAGARAMLTKHRPNIFFEYHWEIAPKLGWTADEIKAVVDAAGAYSYSVTHGDDPVHEYPPKPEHGLAVNVWCQRA